MGILLFGMCFCNVHYSYFTKYVSRLDGDWKQDEKLISSCQNSPAELKKKAPCTNKIRPLANRTGLNGKLS